MLHEINQSFESIFSDSLEASEISSPKLSVRQSKNKIGYRWLSNLNKSKSKDNELSRTVKDLKQRMMKKS